MHQIVLQKMTTNDQFLVFFVQKSTFPIKADHCPRRYLVYLKLKISNRCSISNGQHSGRATVMWQRGRGFESRALFSSHLYHISSASLIRSIKEVQHCYYFSNKICVSSVDSLCFKGTYVTHALLLQSSDWAACVETGSKNTNSEKKWKVQLWRVFLGQKSS